MRRPALLLAAVAALAGCASGPRPGGREVERKADPSAVVATELAMARTAQEKGQWTALRDYAARDAVMFVPEPVMARSWLNGQTNPAQAMRWRVHNVWSSCDGSMAASTGSTTWPDGTNGMFLTIWQRSNDGKHTHALTHTSRLPSPMQEPEAVAASVADCRRAQPLAPVPATPLTLPASGSGAARDQSLSYQWTVGTNLARQISVSMLRDGQMTTVLDINEPGSK